NADLKVGLHPSSSGTRRIEAETVAPSKQSFGSRGGKSHLIRDVRLGVDQEIARDEDNSLIRSATGRGRQVRFSGVGDVYANNREIAGFEFKDVGTVAERDGLRAVRVRVRAESSDKVHGLYVTVVSYPVNPRSP